MSFSCAYDASDQVQVSSSQNMYNRGGGDGLSNDGDIFDVRDDISYNYCYRRGPDTGQQTVRNDRYNQQDGRRGWNNQREGYDYYNSQLRYLPQEHQLKSTQDLYYKEENPYFGEVSARNRLRREKSRRDQYDNINFNNNFNFGRSMIPSTQSIFRSDLGMENTWSDNSESLWNQHYQRRRVSRIRINDNYEDDQDDTMDRKLPAKKTSSENFHCSSSSSYKGYEQGKSRDNYKKKSFRSINTTTTVEVSPGEYMILRGADETWNAVLNDYYISSICICCEMTILCIQDANYILCPHCRVVSPVSSLDVKSCMDMDKNNNKQGGVGLGFTMEDLVNWQDQIAHEHKMLSRKHNCF